MTSGNTKVWRQRLIATSLGLITVLLLLELGLRLLAAGFLWRQEALNPAPKLQTEDGITILCLGESTTAMGGDEAWPNQLARILRKRVPGVQFSAINAGMPGVDTSNILARLDERLAKYQPDIVAAMMGANDSYTGAIPHEGVPRAERHGLLHHFKTWQLLKQLAHNPAPPGTAGSAEPGYAARWNAVDGPNARPTSAGSRADRRVVACARDYMRSHDLEEAGKILRETLRERPDSATLHEELGVVLMGRGQLDAAEKELTRASALDPKAASVYLELARIQNERRPKGVPPLEDQKELLVAQESLLRQALQLDPHHPAALNHLSRLLMITGRSAEVIQLLETNMPPDADPASWPVDALAQAYYKENRLEDAMRTYRKIAETPTEMACQGYPWKLLPLLHQMGRADEARALAATLLDECPDSPEILSGLSAYHHAQQEETPANELSARAEKLRRARLCPLTLNSYRRLKKEMAERGILLVAIQYPRRPLSDLRQYIEPGPGVVLVDNEARFNQAVDEKGFDAIFKDACYGDLGHATPLGNHILAEQVADAILRATGLAAHARPKPLR